MPALEESANPIVASAEAQDFAKFYSNKLACSKQELCQQVEYYFSDANLYVDDYLNRVMSKNDGWVPLETLSRFSRVKKLLAKALKDIPIVNKTLILSSAIRESKSLLKLSEDGLNVQRATPREDPELVVERMVALMGFPANQEFNLEEQRKFWGEYGAVSSIKRYSSGDTYMVVVEFADKETALKVIGFEKLYFKGNEITIRKRMVAKKYQKNRKRKRCEDDDNDKIEEYLPYTEDRLLKLTELPENIRFKSLRQWIENSDIAGQDGHYLKIDWDDECAWLRLKGDVSAEDAVEKLEETPWVIYDENAPAVEVVEEGSEIWKELGTFVNNEPKPPRKKRRKKPGKGKHYQWHKPRKRKHF